MKPNSIHSLLACALPLMLAVGCGGDSNSPINNVDEPVAGAATPGTTDAGTVTPGSTDAGAESPGSTDAGASQTRTVSGRVADGYLQGVTVCVDVNENDACDPDEPNATTVEGGVYDLSIPAEADGKPILADVPPEAIDEDTGVAIGKRIVLATLSDRANFISPITTLVVEELKSNPNFTIDDAEEAVQEVLGINASDDAGLFEDYIAEQKGADTDRSKRFRYLHQTARVVATMLDDIQDQVETSVTQSGVDVAGDEETRLAIRQLVRKEVRELLPEISLAVAEQIAESEIEVENGDAVTLLEQVDPDKLTENLKPGDLEADLLDRIEAIRDQADVQRIAMEVLMKQGIFWLDYECDYADYQQRDLDKEGSGDIGDPIEPIAVVLNDDGAPVPVDLPEDCTAYYGKVQVTGDDNAFTQEQYEFDPSTDTWVAVEEEQDDEKPFSLQLVDGEWKPVTGEEPSGPVTFTDDGSAIVNTGIGELKIFATERVLDNTPVIHHVYERGADDKFLSAVDKNANFPENSSAYELHMKQRADHVVLFTWYSDDSDFSCEEFGGNCNVIDTQSDNGFEPVLSLDVLRDYTQNGVLVPGVMHAHEIGQPIDLLLKADSTDAGGLPQSGSATWVIPSQTYQGPDQTYPASGDCNPGENKPYNPDGVYVDTNEQQYPQEELEPGMELSEYPCVEPVQPPPVDCPDNVVMPEEQIRFSETDQALPGEIKNGCESPSYTEVAQIVQNDVEGEQFPENEFGSVPIEQERESRRLGVSRWKMIDIDGVSMLQLDLPVSVKHNIDLEATHLLLIEQAGYIRRGARLGGARNEFEITYSEAAFDTLRPIIEAQVK